MEYSKAFRVPFRTIHLAILHQEIPLRSDAAFKRLFKCYLECDQVESEVECNIQSIHSDSFVTLSPTEEHSQQIHNRLPLLVGSVMGGAAFLLVVVAIVVVVVFRRYRRTPDCFFVVDLNHVHFTCFVCFVVVVKGGRVHIATDSKGTSVTEVSFGLIINNKI